MEPEAIMRIWAAYCAGHGFETIARREGVSRIHVHMAIDAFKRAARGGMK